MVNVPTVPLSKVCPLVEDLATNSIVDPMARKYLREELKLAFSNEKFFK